MNTEIIMGLSAVGVCILGLIGACAWLHAEVVTLRLRVLELSHRQAESTIAMCDAIDRSTRPGGPVFAAMRAAVERGAVKEATR